MSRTLATGMAAAVAADQGYADVWLLALTSSGGTTYITTAPQDITWDGNTYTAVGGAIEFEPPTETSDPSAQALRITLSGVTQTIISDLLNNNMRGYSCTLYFGQIDIAAGTMVADALEIFTGLLNDRWTIEEVRDETGAGSVTITTSAVSQLARYLVSRQCRTNVASHNDMLQRGGLTTGDTFFSKVPTLIGKQVFWGKSVTTAGGGGLGSGRFDTDRGDKREYVV